MSEPQPVEWIRPESALHGRATRARRGRRLAATALAMALLGTAVDGSMAIAPTGRSAASGSAAASPSTVDGASAAGMRSSPDLPMSGGLTGPRRRLDPDVSMPAIPPGGPTGDLAAGDDPTDGGTPDLVVGPPAELVYRVRTREKVVALTFDDGWSPPAGRLILATLLQEHVAATFFVNAMYVSRDPALWRDIAAAGFPIGNHTYDHRNLTKLPAAEVEADLWRDAHVFQELTGYSMDPIVRPPYGARDAAVDAAALAAGYPTEILWDVVAGDTTPGRSDARQIASASAGRPGSIVLMHVGPASTPRILAAVIARYRARGFRFVTIPELLALRG
jgi:peptidoglycan/xylan/chitin deacetylase (PgdA/CDA1 family)